MTRRSISSFFLATFATVTACAVIPLGLAHAEAEGPAATPESIADALSREVQQVFEKCSPGVVRIEAQDQNGTLVGTGFLIDPNGTIVTSYSVGGESFNLVARSGEFKHPLKRLTADPRSGIALLQVETTAKPMPFLPLGNSRELVVASPVVMVAYPLDLPLAPHFGMVAGFDSKHQGRYFATRHIRANVPVKRGQGGAPLLNMRGEVVGVVISGVDHGISCYALPIEAAAKIHHDYVRFGVSRPGKLGLKIKPAERPTPEGSTAEVRLVDDASPAHAAGIRPGDIIEKIGQCTIQSPDDLLNACFFLTAGDPVEVTLWRNGETVRAELNPVEPSAKHRQKDRTKAAKESLFDITLRPETARQ